MIPPMNAAVLAAREAESTRVAQQTRLFRQDLIDIRQEVGVVPDDLHNERAEDRIGSVLLERDLAGAVMNGIALFTRIETGHRAGWNQQEPGQAAIQGMDQDQDQEANE